MGYSLSPSVSVTEYDLSLGIANLPSAKTGMVLCADTGPCNKITAITNEADLVKKFGKPTTTNYKDWFNAWNFLQYASSLYIVRPTAIATTSNAGTKITNTTAAATELTNMYNSTVAELTLQTASNFTTDTLYFYNKNVTSTQAIALAVCSSQARFVDKIANEFNGKLTVDASTWANVNNVGGFTANTATSTVNLSTGFGLKPRSKFVANGKIFTVQSATTSSINLSSAIYPSDAATYRGTVKVSTTALISATTIPLDLNLGTNFVLGSVLFLGGILWYVSSSTTQSDRVSIVLSKVTGSFGTQTAITAGPLDINTVLFSNTLLSSLTLASVIYGAGPYSVPAGTSVLFYSAIQNYKVGDTFSFTGAGPYTSLVAEAAGNESTSAADTYTILAIDTTLSQITLDKGLLYTYNNAALTLNNVVTTTPILVGYNLYSEIYDDSVVIKTTAGPYTEAGVTVSSIIVESLPKFSNYSEYAPTWSNGEFLTIIFEKTSLGKYAFVEKQLASYKDTARDIQNRNIHADDIFFNSSNYLYCKIGAAVSLVETGTGSIVKLVNNTNSVYPAVGAPYLVGDIQTAFNHFADAESFDVNILIAHSMDINFASTIAETRKDCIAIVAPYDQTVLVGKTPTDATTNLTAKYGSQNPIATDGFNAFGTYSAVYGNMKYQYDKFNDINRWMCAAGDVAGLYAYTDNVRDPWYAPAGLERGKVKNAIKIAFNANKQNRDELYVNSINPIISIQGEGTAVVYGQKTATAKPSALDRVNVRRLLITIEKALASSVKYGLFEFNDEFTRARLVGMIEPYLRTVKARRGVYDFLCVCDESNNPGSVIDANALVIDVYVKPTKVAEYIKLNVLVTRSDASFQELVGASAN